MSPEKLKLYCVASGNSDKLKERVDDYKIKLWRIDLVCKSGGCDEKRK